MRKKREEADRRAAELNQAARGQLIQNQQSKQAKPGQAKRLDQQNFMMQPKKPTQDQFFNPSEQDGVDYYDSPANHSDGFFNPSDERPIKGSGHYDMDALDDLQVVDIYDQTR